MIGLELRKTQALAVRAFETCVDSELLPGHFTVLVLIQNNPGRTQTAIAKAAGLDRSTLVPLLKRFEDQNLITRKPSAIDSRSNTLELTESGRALVANYGASVVEFENSVAAAFGLKRHQRLVAELEAFQSTLVSLLE